jgi:hypothetical protein
LIADKPVKTFPPISSNFPSPDQKTAKQNNLRRQNISISAIIKRISIKPLVKYFMLINKTNLNK